MIGMKLFVLVLMLDMNDSIEMKMVSVLRVVMMSSSMLCRWWGFME